ncbi:hypothetical protein HPY42_02345 [Coprothermobacteraceae bacterium]|nr:hypothetical protein [Coprothermobacteraceae bacterium]
MKIVLSNVPKLWLIDLDGTIVKHNGYLQGGDELLPGAKEFLDSLPETDVIFILSARPEEYRENTESFLKAKGVRFDKLIMGLPQGERILINDVKPSGLQTAHAINVERDQGLAIQVVVCKDL